MIQFENTLSKQLSDLIGMLVEQKGDNVSQCYRTEVKVNPDTYRITVGDIGNRLDTATLLRQMRHSIPAEAGRVGIEVIESVLSHRNHFDGTIKFYEWYLAFNLV